MSHALRFPVFVLAKDSGLVTRLDSSTMLHRAIEPIDVENDEYYAWSAEGLPLRLRVDNGQIVAEAQAEGTPELLNTLLRTLRNLRRPPSVDGLSDPVVLYERIAAAYEAELPRNWLQKRYPRWLETSND